MPENNKTEEFLKKLAPCIERRNMDACVEEAARIAQEMGVGAGELMDLSAEKSNDGKYGIAYVLALVATNSLEGDEKASAYNNAGLAAHNIGKLRESEENYIKAIGINPKLAMAYDNYALLLEEIGKKTEAEEHHRKAIELDPKDADAHYNYANLLEELDRKIEAEVHYKKAIQLNPTDADAHNNYALLLVKLNKKTEAEEHYKKAIEIDPKYVRAHINYALLLVELDRKTEAEEYYKKTIELNPKYADINTYNNYAILLGNLGRKTEEEEQYKKAIELYPKNAEVHFNYAILLEGLDRKNEAEEHYKKAIELNPKYVKAHNNYAILLEGLDRKNEAEEYYKKAIDIDPKYANAHGGYGLLLIKFDKRKDAWKETELASKFCHETGRITQAYLAKAWFYEKYSEKNFLWKKFRESGEDAEKAGDEYLNASETTKGVLKDDMALQGNVLKAKSFVRKIPEKSWYRKILNRFGKNLDISELMDNLCEAAKYYEKASCCSAGERKDICNACFSSIRVFSEILHAMNALVQNDDAEIDKDKWFSSLELAHKIYTDKKLINGAALVDTLKQLIKCVDELAEHRKMGLHIQEERLGKCYNNLLEVSEKLDGALKIIAEHSVETIREYAKKQSMGFIGDEKPKKSIIDNWLIKGLIAAIIAIFLGIISGIIANRFFGYTWVLDKLNSTESVFRGFFNP